MKTYDVILTCTVDRPDDGIFDKVNGPIKETLIFDKVNGPIKESLIMPGIGVVKFGPKPIKILVICSVDALNDRIFDDPKGIINKIIVAINDLTIDGIGTLYIRPESVEISTPRA